MASIDFLLCQHCVNTAESSACLGGTADVPVVEVSDRQLLPTIRAINSGAKRVGAERLLIIIPSIWTQMLAVQSVLRYPAHVCSWRYTGIREQQSPKSYSCGRRNTRKLIQQTGDLSWHVEILPDRAHTDSYIQVAPWRQIFFRVCFVTVFNRENI